MTTAEEVQEETERLDSVVVESKLLDDAIAEGLARLGIAKDEAEVEVLDEGKGGFLGIGAKLAKVKVSRIHRVERMIAEIVETMAKALDETAIVESVEHKGGKYYCEISAENVALILGRRGRTIDALQTLATAMASMRSGDRLRVELDSQGFRQKRHEILVQMAHDAAEESRRYSEPVHLEPMSPQDRKVVHAALSNEEDIETESEDAGDRRHVVIFPKGESSGRSSERSKPAPRGRGGDRRRSGGSNRRGRR